MAKSQLTGSQIKDGTITRDDINVTTTGKSVVAKLIDGINGIKIDTYSGADIGTGDVSLKVDLPYLDTKYPSLLVSKSQNLFFASPAVGSGNPTFRSLTIGDIPLLNYVPLSQKGATNGVATLDATVQIPNSQIPQRLANKVIAIGGEIADIGFTGLIDRNQLALADKEHSVTSVLTGAGTLNSSFNSTVFNQNPDFSSVSGADSTTEITTTITFTSTLAVYSRARWQAFMQTRQVATRYFRDMNVEVMDTSNTWYPFSSVTNMDLIPNSGLYLFPETASPIVNIKAIRIKLSNPTTTDGVVYISNIGFRHVTHKFAPQYPHRAENNLFHGINTFNVSPVVPTATGVTQAVNFGQLVAQTPNNSTSLLTLDLNSLSTPGFYHQTHNVNATPARNYPLAKAGSLRVYNTTLNNQFIQEYTTYDTTVSYVRAYINSAWTNWKQILNSVDTIPQLASYVAQSALNTQLSGYATLNGVETFTNTKTFLQSPIVPNATLLPHAVNFGQMTNAIEESEGNTVGYVSTNYVNTPDGFSVLLNNGTDLNANLKTGFYRGTNLVNAPNGNTGWWYITVETHDSDWRTQKAVSFGAVNESNLIYQRTKTWDGWSNWEQVWTSKQFTQTDINKWNASIEKNVIFSTDSGWELMISDGAFGSETGLVDAAFEAIVAGEENGYWKYGSNIWGVNGIIIDKNTRRIGYGGVLPNGIHQHNFGGTVFINDNIRSAGGFIHNDYDDPNKVLTSDGGVIDKSAFGGTTVKYFEINPGDSFTPSSDYTHFNVLAKAGMKLYLDSGTGSADGQVIVLFHNIGSSTQVWKDGTLITTITGNKTTKFIKTALGWQMTDVGANTFI
ncbi:pyocin knob domain-containing protein [Chryseobacterium sp. Ch-15]|uniref:Pyocin knob domain-containing protein n=1 Tax=Chryseobacterium muglaense TaxID=2893752 RepID=A0A9Q3YRD1_9FLAO|nr:pyocin knob domain-containing protein [Chryseobacterium muglaense]MBD3904489.1 hypothetical protein [Chryseobacterium muglaense]MCC9032692.1 pyocin knob domain-containing protein [Chryseobacterium muglaense]MCM2554251.1 pyocin knob domain-containing protein [Chryseobacterium muglaense]